MLVTAETSQSDRSWLKARARLNISAILVTADTSHFDRSWLKSEASENTLPIVVTPETSQCAIDPYGPSEQSPIGDVLIHSLTAYCSCCSYSGLNAAVVRVGD